MWRGPQKNVTYKLILASPVVSCMACLIWMVLEMEGKWLYICCFVGCCFQDLFYIACSIFMQFPSGFFFICFDSVHVVHSYSSIDITAVLKKFCFILLASSDLHMIKSLLIAVHVFARHILISLSVDEMLLPRYVNLTTDFREPPFREEMAPSGLKLMYSVWSTFTWRTMPTATCSRLCSRDSAWVGVFIRITR